MKDKRGDKRSKTPESVGRRTAPRAGEHARRRPADQPVRGRGSRSAQSGPKTTPVRRPTPAKNAKQAKARAKARKAKAPKVVRPPLRDRVIARLATVDLRPHALAAKVPFVVLVIGSLGLGLGATLWLSTYSAERSYELGTARETNRLLSQQKESLERDVLEAQAAPALAEAARNLGMIPSRDTAHLVQDAAGNWVVVGTPAPAEGTPPPPLNVRLPDPDTERAPAAATPQSVTVPNPNSVEVPVRLPSPAEVAAAAQPTPAPEAAVAAPETQPAPQELQLPEQHAPAGAPAIGPAPGPELGPELGPAPGPAPEPIP